ncbi:hypothetical protein T07_5682 [Trichinella nelsoni]|uniref:Uncharacterized protein n=1 Tax=Trichinella nelsoni TaxID=6336 RepID=A0A0V0S9J0_9BILA|nr:hypothetical protein T07_5682 [Trichinella nelsoni]
MNTAIIGTDIQTDKRIIKRKDDRCCPTVLVSGDGDAAALSSLGVVTTAVSSSGMASTESHSVFSTGLCVCATVDRLLSVPGRTVGLSESQLSLDLPVLRLVVVGPEQFRVYGSSEAQPDFFQLSCKDTDHPFSLTIRRRVKRGGRDVLDTTFV